MAWQRVEPASDFAQERHMSHVTRHTSHVTRHTTQVTRHSSHVIRHTSFVTRHSSRVIRHASFVPPDFAEERSDVVVIEGEGATHKGVAESGCYKKTLRVKLPTHET